jgi:hypothetical protein
LVRCYFHWIAVRMTLDEEWRLFCGVRGSFVRVQKTCPCNISLGLVVRACSPWVWFSGSLKLIANIDLCILGTAKGMELRM